MALCVESDSKSGLSRVDAAICLIIARAEHWHNIELALDALAHARLIWNQQETASRDDEIKRRAED